MTKYVGLILSLCILAINSVYAHDSWIIGTIEDENYKVYEKMTLKVKDPNSGRTYCQADTNHLGVVRLNCDLDHWREYIVQLNKWDEFLFNTEFIASEKDVATIWQYGFNDIQMGVYSQNNEVSINSERYESIGDKLFELEYLETPWEFEYHNHEEYTLDNEAYIYFTCENKKREPTFIYYKHERKDWTYTEALASVAILPEVHEGDTFLYNDGTVSKEIVLSPAFRQGTVSIEDCNEDNSEKGIALVNNFNNGGTNEPGELDPNTIDSIDVEDSVIVIPLDKEGIDKQDEIYERTYLEEGTINLDKESNLLFYLYLILGLVVSILIFIVYRKKGK